MLKSCEEFTMEVLYLLHALNRCYARSWWLNLPVKLPENTNSARLRLLRTTLNMLISFNLAAVRGAWWIVEASSFLFSSFFFWCFLFPASSNCLLTIFSP